MILEFIINPHLFSSKVFNQIADCIINFITVCCNYYRCMKLYSLSLFFPTSIHIPSTLSLCNIERQAKYNVLAMELFSFFCCYKFILRLKK